jgi:CDP-diacylglycerol--serine O-phosphatidyltransferase
LLASFIWISFDNGINGNEIFLGFFQMQWFALIITLFVALSMTADVNFYSGKDINLRNSQPFVVILLIALLFGLISHNPAEVIFIIAFGYSLSGYFNLIRAKFKTSKNFLDIDIFDEK